MTSLTAFFAAGLCLQSDRPGLAAPAFLIFAAPAVWWWSAVWSAMRDRTPVPRSHNVLAAELGFDLVCTCHGVAVSAFFYPDQGRPGDEFDLLLFLENRTTRQRVVHARVGPHALLGLREPLTLKLHLAPGQAAVYRLPLLSDRKIAAGEHDLPLDICVARPAGAGRLLSGLGRSPHDLWHIHIAAPFTVAGEPAPDAAGDLAQPAYLSLASIGEQRPRLEALHTLATTAWDRSPSAEGQA